MTRIAPPDLDLAAALPEAERLAWAAAEVVMAVYDAAPAAGMGLRQKADASPVTAADEAAEALITAGLRTVWPTVPVVAEEAVARGEVPEPARCFWLVDPLDGTREFVARNGEFTVNIALVCDGRPVLGVVIAPAQGTGHAGAQGLGAWRIERDGARRPVQARPHPAQGVVVASSRSHGDEASLQHWLAGALGGTPVAAHRRVGSSLKFGLIAEGLADLYPRLSRTMEWDTAAGDAVLRAAGGSVCTLDGQPLRYGKPGCENPHFVARGRRG
jgi:3'(2'), 5'-bisphosphate nucleotidase